MMIDYWKKLVPMKSKDGGRAAIMFRCIHALMSRQVQGLIKRSIDHFFNALTIYKVGVKARRTNSYILNFFPLHFDRIGKQVELSLLYIFFCVVT